MTETSTNNTSNGLAPYLSMLGLHTEPFSSDTQDEFFFLDPQRTQRLNMLYHLAQNSELLLVVTGEKGSGKTSLLQHFIDMGDDAFTLGRPHPMIDGTMRYQRILAEGQDPAVAVILLDFILGFNASTDPAGELLEAIVVTKKNRKEQGGELTVVASICGTESDPQDISRQKELLENAGVIVLESNARAALFCSELLNNELLNKL